MNPDLLIYLLTIPCTNTSFCFFSSIDCLGFTYYLNHEIFAF